MASTFSTNLAIELIANGEQTGTWGSTTNSNLGTLIEQAISGYVTQAVSTGTDTTITIPNGTTGVARNMFIELTGTGGASTNLIVPANKKLYFIYNNTSSGQVTVKVSGLTGISVANGTKVVLVSNGTDIVSAASYATTSGLTSGRVPFVSTGGVLTDTSDLTWNGAILTALQFGGPINGTVGATTPAAGAFTSGTFGTTLGVTGVTTLGAALVGPASATVFNTVSTTVNAFGAATTLNIGAATGTLTVANTTLAAKAITASTGLTIDTAASSSLVWKYSGTSIAFAQIYGPGNEFNIGTSANGPVLLYSNNAERMRIFANGDTSFTPDGTNTVGTFSTTGLAVTGTLTTTSTINNLTVGRGAGAIATNTAVGASALGANTTGTSHTAVGVSALESNTTGTDNTAIGRETLKANTTAAGGVAVGGYALYSNTTGSSNTAVGTNALYANTTGGSNVTLGYGSLQNNTTADNNTAVGYQAGNSNTTGTGNTFLGYTAGTAVTTGSNLTVIGNTAAASAVGATNEITLGNSSIATLRCQVTTITALSDSRDKENIQELQAGLDFVRKLKPVSFDWNMRDGGKVGIADTGFIAQDLKQVQIDTGITIPDLVYEKNPERLEAGYGKLLPVLVKAIQEQQAIIESLKARLDAANL